MGTSLCPQIKFYHVGNCIRRKHLGSKCGLVFSNINCEAVGPVRWLLILQETVPCCSALTMTGQPMFNQQKLTKRAKRQVGFVLQVMPCLLPGACVIA